MNEDLTPDQKREVFLIQARCGYTPERARAYWENERRARQPKPQSQPLEEEEVQEEETEREPITQEQRDAWERELKEEELLDAKAEILDKIKAKLEKDDELDALQRKELEEITKLKEALAKELGFNQFWHGILSSENWEKILRNYVSAVHGLTNKMASKGVITMTQSDGKITFEYRFFDNDGRPLTTEFDKIEGQE